MQKFSLDIWGAGGEFHRVKKYFWECLLLAGLRHLIFWHSLLLFKLLLFVNVLTSGKVHPVTWEGSFAAQLFLLQLFSGCSKVQLESCSFNECSCHRAQAGGTVQQFKFSSVFWRGSDSYHSLLFLFGFTLQ